MDCLNAIKLTEKAWKKFRKINGNYRFGMMASLGNKEYIIAPEKRKERKKRSPVILKSIHRQCAEDSNKTAKEIEPRENISSTHRR